MSPYLSVIADSFRAASSSRILWIALCCVGLFLVALAPIGYRENVVARISPMEIVNADRLTARFANDLNTPTATPSSRIAAALPEKLQARILGSGQTGSSPIREEDYAEAFNQLIEQDDSWHDADVWSSTTRLKELRELDEQSADNLSSSLRGRRSRLRLEAGLRGSIRPRPEKTISITYATLETPAEWPLSRALFQQYLTGVVLPLVLNGMLGYIGVVLGILVTAPILPDMLQPGSLHLLLSKPISRPLLYVSKFLGGCAFMLMCVGPLLVGVWLILGLRFDLWMKGLFLCIPVYILLFMVYYSVSCLAALRWKSSIVAALVAVAFWVACGIIGFAGSLTEDLVAEPARLEQLMVYGEGDQRTVFAATKGGELVHWNATDQTWDNAPLMDYEGNLVLGPVPLGKGDFAVTRKIVTPVGLRGEGVLAILTPGDEFKIRRGTKLPRGTTHLLSLSDNAVLASGSGGLFLASAETLQGQPAAATSAGGFLGELARMMEPKAAGFQSILPADFYVQSPSQVQLLDNDELIVYSAGLLARLTPNEQRTKWSVAAKVEVEGNVSRETKLAVCKSMILTSRNDEPLRLYDLQTLAERGELAVPGTQKVASMTGDPRQPRFAVLFSNHTGSLLDVTDTPQFAKLPRAVASKSLEHMHYDAAGSLIVVHSLDSVIALPAEESGEPVFELEPRLSNWRMAHHYFVQPLRSIIPQTGELRAETIRAALSGETSQELGEGFFAEKTRSQLNVRRPVLTCAGFTLVMLMIGGLMISRQDF